jgi:hypothetical protein
MAWTTHTTPAAPPVPLPTPPQPPAAPAAEQRAYTPLLDAPDGHGTLTPGERANLPKNPLATTGMWLAIGSGLIPVTLLAQVGGLVLSILGLVRSRRIRETTGVAVGRTNAIVGICISAISVLWFFVVVVPALGALFTPAFDRAATEQAMLDWSGEEGFGFVDVECPSSPSMNEGNTFTCLGAVPDGAQYAITVTVQEAGYLTWQLASE